MNGGTDHETTDCPLAKDVPDTPTGGPGLVGTTMALDGDEGGPVPMPLVAVTVNV